jgi:hypothetical protein
MDENATSDDAATLSEELRDRLAQARGREPTPAKICPQDTGT